MPALYFCATLLQMSTSKLFALLAAALFLPLALFAQQDDRYDPDRALEISQSAVGKTIGDYELHDHLGAPVRLRSDHAGRPLVISYLGLIAMTGFYLFQN